MEVIITKKLKSDNGIEVRVGSDVSFVLCRNKKRYNCIGEVTDIEYDFFRIKNVMIDQMRLCDELKIEYLEVENGEMDYAGSGWA